LPGIAFMSSRLATDTKIEHSAGVQNHESPTY